MSLLHHAVLKEITGAQSFGYLCCITDGDFCVIETNRYFRKIIDRGFYHGFIGKPLYAITTLVDAVTCRQVRNTLFGQPDKVVKIELQTSAAGNPGWFRWEISLVQDCKNNTQRICFIGADITRQKLAEEQLLFRARLLDSISDAVITTNLRFEIKSFNKAAVKNYGLTKKEVTGMPVFEVLAFSPQKENKEQVQEKILANGSWTGELFMDNGNETIQQLHTSVNTVFDDAGLPVGFIFVNRLLHTYSKDHNSMRQSGDKLLKMINEVKDYAILLLDKNGIIQNWNQGAVELKGYSENEAIGMNFRVFYSREDQQKGLPDKLLAEALDNGRSTHEGWRLKKDGSRFWGSIVITALRDEEGNIIGFSKVTRDLTERIKAETRLKESEKRFRSIFNSMYQFIGLLEPDGTTLEINDTALQYAGIDPATVIGQPFWKCPWWTSISKAQQTQLKKAITRAAKGEFVRYEIEIIGKNRVPAVVDFSIKPVTDENGNVILLIPEGREITYVRILQQQLTQQEETRKHEIFNAIIKAQEREREEISYELHDNINQKLATCKLLLEMDMRTRRKASEYVSNSYTYIEEIIQELRKLSGTLCAYALREIGLIAAVKDLTERINSAGKIRIRLCISKFHETRLGHHFKTAIFRIIQEQVNNVLKHANATQVEVILERKPGTVQLAVKDNGIGFNTRKVRRGLGINNILNRVEYFKGQMAITSRPGNGCNLQVTLPLTKARDSE